LVHDVENIESPETIRQAAIRIRASQETILKCPSVSNEILKGASGFQRTPEALARQVHSRQIEPGSVRRKGREIEKTFQ